MNKDDDDDNGDNKNPNNKNNVRSHWGPVSASNNNNKLWCESTTNPVPMLRIVQFLRIDLDQKCNQVIPWSLHTFPGNFMQIGPAVFS